MPDKVPPPHTLRVRRQISSGRIPQPGNSVDALPADERTTPAPRQHAQLHTATFFNDNPEVDPAERVPAEQVEQVDDGQIKGRSKFRQALTRLLK